MSLSQLPKAAIAAALPREVRPQITPYQRIVKGVSTNSGAQNPTINHLLDCI